MRGNFCHMCLWNSMNTQKKSTAFNDTSNDFVLCTCAQRTVHISSIHESFTLYVCTCAMESNKYTYYYYYMLFPVLCNALLFSKESYFFFTLSFSNVIKIPQPQGLRLKQKTIFEYQHILLTLSLLISRKKCGANISLTQFIIHESSKFQTSQHSLVLYALNI